jgi:hypothetical protein
MKRPSRRKSLLLCTGLFALFPSACERNEHQSEEEEPQPERSGPEHWRKRGSSRNAMGDNSNTARVGLSIDYSINPKIDSDEEIIWKRKKAPKPNVIPLTNFKQAEPYQLKELQLISKYYGCDFLSPDRSCGNSASKNKHVIYYSKEEPK